MLISPIRKTGLQSNRSIMHSLAFNAWHMALLELYINKIAYIARFRYRVYKTRIAWSN